LLENKSSIAEADWPVYDESFLQEDTYEYPVMINGKLRFKVVLPLNLEDDIIKEQVLGHEKAQKWIQGSKPKRFIHVPKKIINIVV
jgi:leucyl-tRNA synthetase